MKFKFDHDSKIWLFLVLLWIVSCVIILNKVEAAEPAPTWVVIGDGSATAVVESGIVPSVTAAWPFKVSELARIAPIVLPTAGSSYVYNPGRLRLIVESVPAYAPAGVILAVGMNDFGTGQNIGLVQYQATQVVLRLKALGVKNVVCLTPIRRWDDKTRRGPNPGQVSALGHTLIPVPLVNRLTYSAAIANGCAAGGAAVVVGYTAPLSLGFTHYTPVPQGTTTFQYLNQAGHSVVANWLAGVMKARGFWQ